MRTPMSDARRGNANANNRATEAQRVLSIDEWKDAMEGREDTKEYSVFSIQEGSRAG